jgi:prepilin peptidase CpaA
VEASFALTALCISIAGAVMDIKSAEVPNWLTGAGLAAGLVFRAYLGRWAGLEAGLCGALLGGGVLFLPFLVHGIGGGDLKLMAAVGAWVGGQHAIALILATATAGGLWAIGYAAFHKRTGETLSRMARTIRFHLASASGLFPISPRSRLARFVFRTAWPLRVERFLFLSPSRRGLGGDLRICEESSCRWGSLR